MILACESLGVTPYVPKPLTSGAKADGRYGKQDFVYIPTDDVYRCPAGERLTRRFTSVEKGLNIHLHWTSNCAGCIASSELGSSYQPIRPPQFEIHFFRTSETEIVRR